MEEVTEISDPQQLDGIKIESNVVEVPEINKAVLLKNEISFLEESVESEVTEHAEVVEESAIETTQNIVTIVNEELITETTKLDFNSTADILQVEEEHLQVSLEPENECTNIEEIYTEDVVTNNLNGSTELKVAKDVAQIILKEEADRQKPRAETKEYNSEDNSKNISKISFQLVLRENESEESKQQEMDASYILEIVNMPAADIQETVITPPADDTSGTVEVSEENLLNNIDMPEAPSIIQSEAIETNDESKNQHKEKEVQIPCHVLGRNIKNPLEDTVRKGRVLMKPRLGVKIPYRNLTSQIVSKKEIEEELLERSRLRQSSADPPMGGDLFFKKRLTQRLAKKLTDEPGNAASTSPLSECKTERNQSPSTSTRNNADNSDLIALLEGDDDTEWPVNSTKNNSPLLPKEWEREIALKQLRELPRQTKGTVKLQPISAEKTKTEKKIKEASGDDLKEDTEPKFSSNLVTKTYTRKRKPSEDLKAILNPSSPKKTAAETKASTSTKSPSSSSKTLSISHVQKSPKSDINNSLSSKDEPVAANTYISKRSRVVKRKKIWDPAEPIVLKSPVKSSTKSVKADSNKIDNLVKEDKTPKVKPTTKEVVKSSKSTGVLKPTNKKLATKTKKIIKKKRKLKRLTEIDKLLMDEGAVNLLYSVKNTEELMNIKDKNTTVINRDKAQRELLNKTNEIKNELQNISCMDSPILLRKKEGVVLRTQIKDTASSISQRKKSKDSAQSPPASPGFTYPQNAEASRIIRRHSSSSFSSENPEYDENDVNSERPKQKSENSKKKNKTGQERKSNLRRSSIGIDKQHLNQEMAKNFNKVVENDVNYTEFQTVTVRKFEGLTQVIMAPLTSNGHVLLSVQILSDLTELLKIFQKEESCVVVLISSSGSSFCHGVDYKALVVDETNERRKQAETYAFAVREFLITLSKFTKIIIAGVHGSTVGLGVTMLPLFDMVIASDTATFSTPYLSLGCAAEGGTLFTLPHIMNKVLTSELFFASRKLTAAEALHLGLVKRTLWPDKFQEELISTVKVISRQSAESMQAIKRQLQYHLMRNLEVSLKWETSILVERWISNECQKRFGAYALENK